MAYLTYNRTVIKPHNDVSLIERMYAHGYLFGRVEPGQMDETTSLRINLAKFDLTSENRRILRKTESLKFFVSTLPLQNEKYHWMIHKIGKDFYTTKFGEQTFSASKIKELCTTSHNFNTLLSYTLDEYDQPIGHCIAAQTDSMLHYCYPFYRLDIDTKNIGMGMMLKAITASKSNNKNFVYLGSVQRDSDKYKLQFKGLELWDHENQSWRDVLVG